MLTPLLGLLLLFTIYHSIHFNYLMPSGAHDLFLGLAVPTLFVLIVLDFPSSSLVNQSIILNHITLSFSSYLSPHPSIPLTNMTNVTPTPRLLTTSSPSFGAFVYLRSSIAALQA